MNILRILFPMWYTFEELNETDEDRMKRDTIELARELEGTDINTPQQIQEYINKKK